MRSRSAPPRFRAVVRWGSRAVRRGFRALAPRASALTRTSRALDRRLAEQVSEIGDEFTIVPALTITNP